MPLKYRLPLLFLFSFLILVFSVDAVHGPSPAHARRSLAFKKKSQRQLGITDLTNVVNNVLDSGTTPTPGPTSSSSTPPGSSSSPTDPTTLPTNTDPPSTSTTPSSSDTSSTTPTPSTSDPPSSSSSSPTTTPTSTTTDPGSSSSSSPTTDTPTSTPPTTTPTSSPPPATTSIPPNCLLNLLGDCVSSSSSPPVSSSTSDTPVTTSTTPTASSPSSTPTDSPSSSPTDSPTSQSTPTSSSGTPTPTSTPDCPLGVVIGGVCVLPGSTSTPPATLSVPPSTSEPPPSTSPPSTTPDLGQSSSSPSPTTPDPGSSESPTPTPTPTSSSPVDPCGPVGIALGLCSSNSNPPASTSPSTSTPPPSPSPSPSESLSSSTPPLTSSPSPSVDPCGDQGIALGLCTPSVVPSSTTSTQPPSQSTDPCDAVGIALGLCPSSSLPPVSSSSSPPATITPPPQSCDSLGLCSSTTTNSETQIPSGTITSSSQPSLSSGQSSSPSDVSTGLSDSSSGLSSSSTPVISFPTGNNSDVSSTTSFSSTATDDRPLPTFIPPPQTQLSYVTVTSLLLVSSVTSSFSDTLSDPDAVPPTLTFATPSNSLPTATPINLPPDLPARIYPPNSAVDPNSLNGYSLVSVLFQSSLPWGFVTGSAQVQGELFLYFPSIISTALDINPTEVMTYALQVYVPASYQGPQDVDSLRTNYLFYIPTNEVPVLAAQIKVNSSPFYTSLSDPYHTLAAQVDSSFSVTSIGDPNTVPGTTSSVAPPKNNSRKDAIIGVTSALGGLALGALGVLVYRSVKRSRDLRHRRLAEPNAPNDSYPDRTGRDFDQDSIGGQRRRSFYFAEDSLRGQEAVQQTAVPVAQLQGQHVIQPVSQVEYSYRTSPDGVRERRAPVVTGAISAPILTQSSLNW